VKDITVNGRDLGTFIAMEMAREINDFVKEENKVSIYHTPMKSKNWSPYNCKSSKVRKVEVDN